MSDAWLAGLLRTRVLARIVALAMTLAPVRRFAFRTVSQTGIRYPGSALSDPLPGLPGDAPHAGDRFPWLRFAFVPGRPAADLYERLDDTRFTLLLIGQDAAPGHPEAVSDIVDVLAIPRDATNDAALARARFPRPSWYLLRPDGHIGVAGTLFEAAAVGRYLAQRVHLRAAFAGARAPG